MTESADERLAILVHEVRSPVAALAAVAEALADLDDGPGRRELVRLALGACAAIERIVTDIKVASVRPVPVDVGTLVDDLVAARVVAGVAVEARVEAGLPRLEADPVRLRQALDNLVTNAIVHGGGHIVVTVASSTGGLVFSVADEGEGISAADAARIFEPGVRLDEGRAGSGLGLALTKAIVDAHRGTITVESTPGRGATFTIVLPTDRLQPET
jgi:two-component system sensor histidine kinase BaeS